MKKNLPPDIDPLSGTVGPRQMMMISPEIQGEFWRRGGGETFLGLVYYFGCSCCRFSAFDENGIFFLDGQANSV